MKVYNTVIVGAGIAGIAAAKTLQRSDPSLDWLIVSPDIGGRIVSSKDGAVQYGAYFAISNYKNAFSVIEKGKRLRVFNLGLYRPNQKPRSGYRIFLHPIQVIRLLVMMGRFSKRYKKFKAVSAIAGQKKALQADSYLHKLFTTNAEQFADEHGFGQIARDYISFWVRAISFTTLNRVSAFDLLRFSAGAFSGYHHYSFEPNVLRNEWGDKYLQAEVNSINRAKHQGHYEIQVGDKTVLAKKVILATPPGVTQGLIQLERVKEPIDAYMLHIDGEMHPKWHTKADFLVFDESYNVISIAKEKDGSFLLYARLPEPDLDKFFKSHELIATKHWSPAFNLVVDDTLIDQEIDDHFYIAGDFNIAGIEDAYITGVYAANRVLQESDN